MPSGLLIAVTAHISTDVAAAPLLWVLPLSLYLLTWVVVFQSRPLLPHKWMLMLQPVAIAGVIFLLAFGGEQNLLLTLGGHQLCFFVIAMACHGELARTRPAAKYLTGFYVALSFGGMVGGLFAGLSRPSPSPGSPNIRSWSRSRRCAGRRRTSACGHRSKWYWLALAVLAVALVAPSYMTGELSTWLEDHRVWVAGAVGVLAALLALALNARPLEDLRHRRARAGVDPDLSGRRGPRHDRAQLLRRAQDRGDAGRLFPRADARHHDPRRRAFPQQ